MPVTKKKYYILWDLKSLWLYHPFQFLLKTPDKNSLASGILCPKTFLSNNFEIPLEIISVLVSLMYYIELAYL